MRDDFEDLVDGFLNLMILGNSRGRDSWGIALVSNSGIPVFKGLGEFTTKDKVRLYQDIVDLIQTRGAWGLVGNNRAKPLPEGYSDELNYQPLVLNNHLVVSHNGTISNDTDLIKAEKFKMNTQIDSEVLLHLYEKYSSMLFQPMDFLEQVIGGIACVLVDTDGGVINIYRNFKPLWLYKPGVLWIHSERENLVKTFGEEKLGQPLYQEVENFTCHTVYWRGFRNTVTRKLYTKTKSHLPQIDPNKAYAMCSGGIDSVTAAFVAKFEHKKDVTLVNFNYGQKAFVGENLAVAKIASKYHFTILTVDFSEFGKLGASPLTSSDIPIPEGKASTESTLCWVPSRNLMFISYLFSMAEANGVGSIYTGWNLEESGVFPDNDIDFFHLMNRVSNYATLSRPKLILVLEKLMKSEILHLGIKLGVPYELTWSCDASMIDEKGAFRPCGKCGCCVTRRHAFKAAGLEDKQIYIDSDYEKYSWNTEEKTSNEC